VYLRDYQTPVEARLGLERYFGYYNHLRRHRSLERRTPASVYGLAGESRKAGGIELPSMRDTLEAGGGWSAAASVAAAPVALRAPSAAATARSPMPVFYSCVPRIGPGAARMGILRGRGQCVVPQHDFYLTLPLDY